MLEGSHEEIIREYIKEMRARMAASRPRPKYPEGAKHPGGPAMVGESGPEYVFGHRVSEDGRRTTYFTSAWMDESAAFTEEQFNTIRDRYTNQQDEYAEVIPPPQSAAEFMEQLNFPKPVRPEVVYIPFSKKMKLTPTDVVQATMKNWPGLITKLTPSKVMQGGQSIILWQ
jgi:hypothetical protein